MQKITFNKPYLSGNETKYVLEAHKKGHLSGDGEQTKSCHKLIETITTGQKALLTHSCTGALEMIAMLLNVAPGDEVIMPSFTFVSTANAFVLRGAVPVFVDIRPDTLNINEKLIETAITKRTKAIMVVHYAGVACEMDAIIKIAKKHKLIVVEDAAQGFMSTYKGKHLGTIGDLAAYSFHETKNIISGEGGALIINKEKYIERAEIIREKGTDRSRFFRGQVDKYSWVDIGSSYLPSEIVAAFLRAQLENAEKITRIRVKKWNTYHTLLAPLAKSGYLVHPTVPKDCVHNGHLYYILLNDLDTRTRLINRLKEKGIMGVFHYIPLHSSPAGLKYCKTSGKLPVTDKVSDTLLRLPLFYDLTDDNQQMICREIAAFFGSNL